MGCGPAFARDILAGLEAAASLHEELGSLVLGPVQQRVSSQLQSEIIHRVLQL